MRFIVLLLVLGLSGCASERHFTADTLWPFGNPNAPAPLSETAQRALGHDVPVTPLAPQPGNVWPGPVQPVPTIADTQAHMTQPLGDAYTPSLPSPYPPGTAPPTEQDLQGGPLGNGANPAYTPPGIGLPGDAPGQIDSAPPNAAPGTVPASPGSLSGGSSAP